MSPATIAVGNDVRARCAACKRTQIHMITAISGKRIDQIQCKACLRTRKYRPQESPDAPKRRRQGAIEVIPPEVAWKKLMDSSTTKKTNAYTFDKQYRVHDLINHESFGMGVVTSLPTPNKARGALQTRGVFLFC